MQDDNSYETVIDSKYCISVTIISERVQAYMSITKYVAT